MNIFPISLLLKGSAFQKNESLYKNKHKLIKK